MSESIVRLAPTTPLAQQVRLSSQTIIFTNGPALTGKTTIARCLGEQLGVAARSTYRHGHVLTQGQIDEEKREIRYQELFREVERDLRSGRSVVLDGRFSEPARRAQVYRLARKYRTRVIVIKTWCDSRVVIQERIRRRQADPGAPDHEAASMSIYESTVRDVRTHPIEHDPEFGELGVEVVEFHTGDEAFVACAPDARADARKVASVLGRSGLLCSSAAGAPIHRPGVASVATAAHRPSLPSARRSG